MYVICCVSEPPVHSRVVCNWPWYNRIRVNVYKLQVSCTRLLNYSIGASLKVVAIRYSTFQQQQHSVF